MDHIDRLISLLNSEDIKERKNAVHHLSLFDDPRVVPALVNAMKNNHNDVERLAQNRLVCIGRPAVHQLIEVLNYEDKFARGRAGEALGYIGEISALPALIESLEDPDHSARFWKRAGIEDLLKKGIEIIDSYETLDQVTNYESELDSAFAKLKDKHGLFKPFKAQFIELKSAIAKKKNALSNDKGILLDKTLKPPKGRAYQQIRRVRNG